MESNTKPSSWAGIAIGSFTVISAVIGSKIHGFTWLLYLCGLILAISLLKLIWDFLVGGLISTYFLKRKTMKHLRNSFDTYLKITQKFRILIEIEAVLSLGRVDWNNRRPHLFVSVQNSLSNIEYGLDSLPAEYRIIATNIALRELVRSFDGWLNTCDDMLKNGHAKYKTEDVRNDILVLISKYRGITLTHDEYCQEVNAKLKYGKLSISGLFCQTHGFNWKNAEPQA